jgi:hypothetical protein
MNVLANRQALAKDHDTAKRLKVPDGRILAYTLVIDN